MLLPKEAKYLNTHSFILKVATSMFFAFLIGSHLPIVNKDMISFLFGLILTLEPVNVTGYRTGINQFVATLTGGVITGAVVYIFGATPLALGLSMALVLYFTLLRDWRNLSVVALFTTIYMTQLIQLNAAGQPDIPMTLLVRVTALSAGIVFAMIANIIFSIVVSPNFAKRRLAFLEHRFSKHLKSVLKRLNNYDMVKENDYMAMSMLFKDINWTISLIKDFKKDPVLKFRKVNISEIDKYIVRAEKIRMLSHYLADIEMLIDNAHPFCNIDDDSVSCNQDKIDIISKALLAIEQKNESDIRAIEPLLNEQGRIYESLNAMIKIRF